MRVLPGLFVCIVSAVALWALFARLLMEFLMRDIRNSRVLPPSSVFLREPTRESLLPELERATTLAAPDAAEGQPVVEAGTKIELISSRVRGRRLTSCSRQPNVIAMGMLNTGLATSTYLKRTSVSVVFRLVRAD
jgi:hypothetical protein